MKTTRSVRAAPRPIPPSTSWTKRTRALLASVLTAAAASLLAASCHSSGNGFPGGSCTNGGAPCAHGCVEGVGCAECEADTDCTPNAPFCVTGGCVACRTTADCAVGQACFPRDHSCQTKCTANPNCPGDAPTCDTTTGECVGCLTSMTCPPGSPICVAGTGQCSQCEADSDCSAADPICDLAAGQCVQCLVDSQCPAGYLCNGGNDHQCRPGCKSNADCDGNRPFCDVNSGICLGCQSSQDCGATAPICSMAGDCVQCVTAADCKNPTDPFCTPDGACVQCNTNADCKAPLPVCNGNTCAQCAGNGQAGCPAGQKCHAGTCQ